MCTNMGDPEIHSNLKRILDNPTTLAQYSPAEWKALMILEGRIPNPLSSGALKGIPFEEGGGFKVNFKDGGLFMYHPSEKSYHNGAYYKISSSAKGLKRYDTKGREIK